MLESLNTGIFEYEKLKPEEMRARGILGRLVGVMADTVNPTRNGRSYSAKLWENVFNNPIMKERIENKCCFGELGHPLDREETDMEKIAICMDGLPKKDKDGKLQAVFNILDTPNGRILKTLCDYGCNIGISSRGSGDLVTDFDGNESVDPDTYNCEGWDAVLIPAVKEARLKYVTESLDKKRYNKSLRARLIEAVNKEDVDKKKAMTESLHTFLGESIWDEIENDVTEPAAGPEPNEDFVDNLDNNMEQNQDNIDNTEIDDAITDDGSLDIEMPDQDPEPSNEVYKGVEIIQDPDSNKFVCEINQDTYVFNSIKNAKIWIDMNEDELETTVEDSKKVSESLNEEQVGRDIDKDDKDIDDVMEPESEDKEDEDKDKIVITMNESWNDLNGTEQFAAEKIINAIQYGEIPRNDYEEFEYAVQSATSMYGDANEFLDPSDPMYHEEGSFGKVRDYLLNDSYYSDMIKEYVGISNSSINEAKYTRDELFDKFGTDDLDIINAGNEEDVELKASDVGFNDIDGLQEMLKENLKLRQDIIELQEKLSVSNAKERKLSEDLISCKEKITKLSRVSKENSALKEQLKSSKNKLDESLNKKSSTIKSLNEQLKAKDTELDKLKEDYASLDKDLTQVNEQFSKKFERQNKLLEKYQKITKNSVDKYIGLQANNLGIKPIEIKNRLPEKFSFSDIDSICESLRDYKLSISRLPFNTSKSLNESNIKVNNLSKPLIPGSEIDEINDYDMKLMEKFM